MLDDAIALFLVEVEDGLGIASRSIAVPARLQAGSKVGVVVDLAVEDDPDVAVLVAHRLFAAGHVDDGQPGVRKPHASVDDEA